MIFTSTLSPFCASPFLDHAINISHDLSSGRTKPNLSLSLNTHSKVSSLCHNTCITIASSFPLKSTTSAFTLSPSSAPFFFFPYTKYPCSCHSTSTNQKFPSHPLYIHSTTFSTGFFSTAFFHDRTFNILASGFFHFDFISSLASTLSPSFAPLKLSLFTKKSPPQYCLSSGITKPKCSAFD
jgi:hypothetical protein